MILTAFHGFCMALADSVPGVSGGTIAFILGFYDHFLDTLHDLFGKDGAARRTALIYLLKLGASWAAGMIACVPALSNLFEKNIYFMSSLFLGLTLAFTPFIAAAERTALKKFRSAPFALLGMAVVVGLTLLRGSSALGSVSFASLSLLYIFLSGAVAITAMVLPGLFALGFGVLAGVALSIHAIRTALHKYRSEMVWLILGLMLGSLYAIVYGAVNLTVPLPPMSLVTFDAPAPLLGVAILLGLELLRGRMEAGPAAGKERIAHEH